MTSMPASRRARAITFAPRSWPSNPGLATNTRIGLVMACALKVRRLRIRAEDSPERVANLAQRGVRPHRIQKIRHRILRAFAGAFQSVQALLHSAVVPPPAERRELLALMLAAGLVDLQKFDRLIVALEAVHPHDHPLPSLHFLLIPVARRRDLRLRKTLFNRRNHAAHLVDAPDVVIGRRFGIE